jgi:serine/threonine protein phosphatase 1
MGDPHGGLRSIKQVLERANFDFKKDQLIVLGDVADGWPEACEAFEFIITQIKHLIYVRGNHDQWLKEFLEYGKQPDIWTLQ